MFDVLLSLKGGCDCFVWLKKYQCLDAVPLGEAIRQAFSMLVNAPHQIVRHADIQRSTGATGEDVHPIGHLVLMDCRVKPGNDDCEKLWAYTRIGIST
jgi:hypothetical protein